MARLCLGHAACSLVMPLLPLLQLLMSATCLPSGLVFHSVCLCIGLVLIVFTRVVNVRNSREGGAGQNARCNMLDHHRCCQQLYIICNVHIIKLHCNISLSLAPNAHWSYPQENSPLSPLSFSSKLFEHAPRNANEQHL